METAALSLNMGPGEMEDSYYDSGEGKDTHPISLPGKEGVKAKPHRQPDIIPQPSALDTESVKVFDIADKKPVENITIHQQEEPAAAPPKGRGVSLPYPGIIRRDVKSPVLPARRTERRPQAVTREVVKPSSPIIHPTPACVEVIPTRRALEIPSVAPQPIRTMYSGSPRPLPPPVAQPVVSQPGKRIRPNFASMTEEQREVEGIELRGKFSILRK